MTGACCRADEGGWEGRSAQAQTHHRQVLDDWRDPRNTPVERKELAALSSDTGGFVGFLTYDLDQAARHAADAVRIATDTDSARNLTAAFAAQSAITARRQGR